MYTDKQVKKIVSLVEKKAFGLNDKIAFLQSEKKHSYNKLMNLLHKLDDSEEIIAENNRFGTDIPSNVLRKRRDKNFIYKRLFNTDNRGYIRNQNSVV